MSRYVNKKRFSLFVVINLAFIVASIILKNYISDLLKKYKEFSIKDKITFIVIALALLIIVFALDIKLYKLSVQKIDDVVFYVTEKELDEFKGLTNEEAIAKKIKEILSSHPDKKESIEKILEVLGNEYKHIALQLYLSASSVDTDDRLNNFWHSKKFNIDYKNNTLKEFFEIQIYANDTSLQVLNESFAKFLSIKRLKEDINILVLSYNFDEKLNIHDYYNIYQLVLNKDMAKEGIIAHMELTGNLVLKDKFEKCVKGYDILKNVPDYIVKSFLQGDSKPIKTNLTNEKHDDLLTIFGRQKEVSNHPTALEFKKEEVPTKPVCQTSALTQALKNQGIVLKKN